MRGDVTELQYTVHCGSTAASTRHTALHTARAHSTPMVLFFNGLANFKSHYHSPPTGIIPPGADKGWTQNGLATGIVRAGAIPGGWAVGEARRQKRLDLCFQSPLFIYNEMQFLSPGGREVRRRRGSPLSKASGPRGACVGMVGL